MPTCLLGLLLAAAAAAWLLWDADFGRWAFLTPPEHKKYGYTEFL
jgi:hypothetical protein